MKTKHDDLRHETSFTHQPGSMPTYFRRKAWPVRIIGAAMLLIASPVILLLVVLVRLTSPGPALYRQARTGRHGKEFMMYKIRTMYQDAESVSGPVWCLPGDSRITPLGKILRLLHLDELPQLINVARGEMGLIGPRPERPAIVARLVQEIPDYHTRLLILPGVTGLAQINLPPDVTTDCVRKKLVLDRAYIAEASAFIDLRILMCTMLRMIGVRHGRAAHWLRVQRHVNVSESEYRVFEPEPRRREMEYQPAAMLQFDGRRDSLAFAANGIETDFDLDPSDTQDSAEVAHYLAPRPR